MFKSSLTPSTKSFELKSCVIVARNSGMGQPPAVIIIVRHGARLDAEDATWHTTSPAPYDTPLSYGGWTQTRALGARIASLLHAREMASSEEPHIRPGNDASSSASNRKKQRVLLHSSPFLRCVQSSVAIAAGMAQYTGNLHRFESASESKAISSSPRPAPRLSAAQTRAQTLDSSAFEARYSRKPASASVSEASSNRPQTRAAVDSSIPHFTKPTLRIDAFLGEWLSPEYFEFITPPPPSNMMVAGAKAELIKAGEPVQGARLDTAQDTTPRWQSWGDLGPSTTQSPGDVLNMEDLARTLPTVHETPAIYGYTPPTPLYALSASEPIPSGYVSHARDACVDIDFQWDSMRGPQNWGDGGEHGEEWSALHNRFRQGIRNMIEWYKLHGSGSQMEQEELDDEEVVLVLVTHGAGCNALIGALTNQPVLMDIGMASLTMAVQRNKFENTSPFPAYRRNSITSSSPHRSRRRSSVDLGLSQDYDMKLIASSEHLRAGADPLRIPQLHTQNLAIISERGRQDTLSSVTSNPADVTWQKNSALGSIRRSTVNSRSSRSYTGMSGRSASPVPSLNGAALWSNRRSSTVVSDDGDPPSPKSDGPDHSSAHVDKPKEGSPTTQKQASSPVHHASATAVSSTTTATGGTWQPQKTSNLSRAGTVHQGGLWGSTTRTGSSPNVGLKTVRGGASSSPASRIRAYTTNEKL